MATGFELPRFSINENPQSAGTRWLKWISRFENYLLGFDINAPTRKRALLLYFAGEEVQEIFEGLSNTGEIDDYDRAKQSLNSYFTPKRNVAVENLIFRQAKQEPEETIQTYAARLRKLGLSCEFEDIDKQILIQIIQTCNSKHLKEKALITPDITLPKLLELAKTMELVSEQMEQFQVGASKRGAVAAISSKTRINYSYKDTPKSHQPFTENKYCFNCGKDFPHKGGKFSCPARGARCNKCKKVGHFARSCRQEEYQRQKYHEEEKMVCPQKPWKKTGNRDFEKKTHTSGKVNTLTLEAEEGPDIFAVTKQDSTKIVQRLWIPVIVNGVTVRMLADTGAAVNLIEEKEWEIMTPRPELNFTFQPIFGYDLREPIPVKGIFEANLEYGNTKVKDLVYVVPRQLKETYSILGCKACLKLNIVTINSMKRNEKDPGVEPGSKNIADYLARSPVEESCAEDHQEENEIEANRVLCLHNNIPKAISLDNLEEECVKDRVIHKAKEILKTSGNWMPDPTWKEEEVIFFKALAKVQPDLSVVGNVLVKKQNIVVPQVLQQQMIKLAHEGHQGVTKTKRLLRSKVWFPNLDALVEKELAKCTVCQTLGSTTAVPPLQMTELPNAAWQEVSVDFCGPLPNGKYLLVLVDEYSRYPVISTVTSTSTFTTVTHLRRIFSLFGTPEKLKSDNGPPFFSRDFKTFMDEMGIKHKRITPEWPQANGTVERMMRSIKRVLQSARVEGKNWEVALENWSKNYLATPHSTTGESPFELMFNRKMNISIPQVLISENDSLKPNDEVHSRARVMDAKQKEKAKKYADEKRKAKPNILQIGDRVLLRQKQKRKWDPPFDPEPWIVCGVKGTFILVQRGEKKIGRNISCFRKLEEQKRVSETEERVKKTPKIGVSQWDPGERWPDTSVNDQRENQQNAPPNHRPQPQQQEIPLDDRRQGNTPNVTQRDQYNFRNRQQLRPKLRLIEEM